MSGRAATAESANGGSADPQLIERIRRLLMAQAKRRQVIAYRDLARLAELTPPHTIHRLTLALEDILRQDVAAGRPLLAALAVSRGPQALPGSGFFQLLRTLGQYDGPEQGPEAAAFHARELERLWARWSPEAGGEER